MTASTMETILLTLVGFLVLLGLTAAVVLGVVFLRARRRWHAVRDHAATRSAVAAGSVVVAMARSRNRTAPPSASELGGWTSARTRRELWRGVDAAQAAVRSAQSMAAPVGDLPALCQRLRRHADTLDAILRHETGTASSPTLRAQVAEVLLAADTIQRAGVLAAGESVSPEIGSLTRDAELEVECVTTGLAAMRSTSGRSRN